MATPDKLLMCRAKRPAAKVRLICFPWSGGGATVFNPWNKLLPESIELVGVTLPGRETRYKEDCCYSAVDAVSLITDRIHQSYADKPFFFFGHSLGALLCQEVATKLKAEHDLEPAGVYLSGESPPHSTKKRRAKKNYKDMSEEDMKREVRRMGLMSASIMTSDEMLKIYLPPLRADLTLVDQLAYDIPCGLKETKLTCPVTVIEAYEDNEYDTKAWNDLTLGPFSVKHFTGAHMYVKDPENQKRICELFAVDAGALALSS